MKQILQILGFLLISINLVGQASDSVIYYKDYYRWKEVTKEKAKFKLIKSELEDGKLQVEFVRIRDNKKFFHKEYLNNYPVGIWEIYKRNGSEVRIMDFEKLVYSDEKNENGYYFEFKSSQENDGYKPAHISMETYMRYLNDNVKYPQDALETEAQGQVQVQVKINKEGKSNVISIYKGVNPYLDYEAYRVISEMPNWRPAMKDNVPIESYTIIPLRFKIN